MKNKIIIVGGYCATGKSTFSGELSHLLNIPCFNKDTIKEILGEGLSPEDNMLEKNGSNTTFMLMLHIAEQFLISKNICILESNFKINESELLKKLLEKYDCECLTFIFKGDLEVLFKRYMEREKMGKRHWIHITFGENSDKFKKYHQKNGIGEVLIGKTIVTDTTVFDEVNYDELYETAKIFMEAII
jgi:predicted kinase